MCHSVHNTPHGYSVTAHPCYGVVGAHSTGMLFLFVHRSFHSRDWKPLPCKVASLGIFLCEHKSNIKMAEILVSSTFFKRETFTDLELWKGTDFFVYSLQ